MSSVCVNNVSPMMCPSYCQEESRAYPEYVSDRFSTPGNYCCCDGKSKSFNVTQEEYANKTGCDLCTRFKYNGEPVVDTDGCSSFADLMNSSYSVSCPYNLAAVTPLPSMPNEEKFRLFYENMSSLPTVTVPPPTTIQPPFSGSEFNIPVSTFTIPSVMQTGTGTGTLMTTESNMPYLYQNQASDATIVSEPTRISISDNLEPSQAIVASTTSTNNNTGSGTVISTNQTGNTYNNTVNNNQINQELIALVDKAMTQRYDYSEQQRPAPRPIFQQPQFNYSEQQPPRQIFQQPQFISSETPAATQTAAPSQTPTTTTQTPVATAPSQTPTTTQTPAAATTPAATAPATTAAAAAPAPAKAAAENNVSSTSLPVWAWAIIAGVFLLMIILLIVVAIFASKK